MAFEYRTLPSPLLSLYCYCCNNLRVMLTLCSGASILLVFIFPVYYKAPMALLLAHACGVAEITHFLMCWHLV